MKTRLSINNIQLLIMKKILTLCVAAALVFTGCSNKEKEEQLRQAQAVAEASREELADAVSDRDQLLGLVNEISSSMEQIKQLENILTVSGGSETPGQREQIRADIAAIQETLVQRRHQLEDLEKKLSKSNLNNSKLQQTITSLRTQLDGQAQEIASLRTSLTLSQCPTITHTKMTTTYRAKYSSLPPRPMAWIFLPPPPHSNVRKAPYSTLCPLSALYLKA